MGVQELIAAYIKKHAHDESLAPLPKTDSPIDATLFGATKSFDPVEYFKDQQNGICGNKCNESQNEKDV